LLHRPLRARFVSAGSLFAAGTFVSEVQYDPELYFLGEEAAMTVRAFAVGYDLFHSCEPVVWHNYIRNDAVKHWDDHAVVWNEQDLRSKNKIAKLLAGEPLEALGLRLLDWEVPPIDACTREPCADETIARRTLQLLDGAEAELEALPRLETELEIVCELQSGSIPCHMGRVAA
jgi:Glycosyltransferase (GlcNAc)